MNIEVECLPISSEEVERILSTQVVIYGHGSDKTIREYLSCDKNVTKQDLIEIIAVIVQDKTKATIK